MNKPISTPLIITTPSRVYTWNSSGLHVTFVSSKRGIVTSRSAGNHIAVAGTHVVVLHPINSATENQQRSWGLEAAEDNQVRQLEYAPTAKRLYLSTTLTGAIQEYSLEDGQTLTATTPVHPTSPVALAVSPDGKTMISASESPPVSYLHDLENNISRQIKPQASTTAVCVAAFHPRRAHSFLLGFKDGTLAGYNARKVKGERGDGEVSHLKRLHQSTAAGGGTVAGAVFLEGHKSRAVSISADGRCRLVDFADGGVVLRSWHAQGELTCVAVFDGLIAVGRRDGQVQVYDEVGILKATRSVAEEKIIGVEWVSGEEYAAEMQEERGFVSALGSYPSLTSPEDVREADPPQDKFLSLFSPLKAVEDEPPPPVPLRIRPLRQGMSTEAQPPVKRMVDPSPRKFAMLRTPKRSALPKNSSNAERNAKLLADLRRLNPREKKGTLALYSSDSQRLAPVTKEDESPDKEGPMDIWLTEPSSGSESERPKREKVRKSRFAERFSTLNSEDPKMSSPAKSTLKGDEESDYKTASPGKSLVGEEASGEKESSEESGKTVVRTHIESIGTCVRAKYDGNDSTESVYQKDGEYRVQCADCIKTKDEIARLKGEIMALRAVMRRHGIVTSDYRK